MFEELLMTITNEKKYYAEFLMVLWNLKPKIDAKNNEHIKRNWKNDEIPCLVYRFSRSLGRLLWLYTSIQFIIAMKIYMSCSAARVYRIGVDVFYIFNLSIIATRKHKNIWNKHFM